MSERTAVCAHLVVRYETEQMADGGTRGWWACKDCGMSFGPRPAARPGGEGTPTDEVAAAHSRLLDLVLSRKYSGASLQKAIRELIAAAEQRGRSPAPASGAPDEDVKRFALYHEGSQAWMDEEPDGAYVRHEDYTELRTRLAAAERAGVALREALTFYATQANWFSPSEGFALQYDSEPSPVARDSGAKARAALTPTGSAPSPEERANG